MSETEWDALQRFRATQPLRRRVVDGVRWEFLACGQGADSLLLLPGALGWAETAFHFITAFAPTWRVLSVSYPAGLRALGPCLDGLHELLQAEGQGPVSVVGGSYSGVVAQFLVERHPAAVKRLILAHTGVPTRRQALAARALLLLLRLLPMPVIHALGRGLIGAFLPQTGPMQAFWRRYFYEIIPSFTRADLLARLAISLDAARAGLPPGPSGWQGPVLIVQSAHDALVPPAQQTALAARFPQAWVRTLDGHGHQDALVAPHTIIALYRDFLERS